MGNDTSKQEPQSSTNQAQVYEVPRRASIHIPVRSSHAPPPYVPQEMRSNASNANSSQVTPRMSGTLPRRGATVDDGPRPQPAGVNRSSTIGHRRAATIAGETLPENDLLLLCKFDTVFLVDDSGSMHGGRWEEARNALAGVAEIATRYDADGVDVLFLNNETEGKNVKTAAEVSALFDSVTPDGQTPTGERIEMILLEYLENLDAAYAAFAAGDRNAKKSVKPLNLIVITDGEASDDPEYVIVKAAKRMDASHFPSSQVGIQFVQIGDDPRATEALNRLDDGLETQYGIRDMVDTVPFGKHGGRLTSELLTHILLGGINRRWDSRAG